MLNKVMLVGRLGGDVKKVKTKTNSTIANASICTSVKQGADAEYEEKLDWHNLIFFGRSAELVARIAKKGDAISVIGKLKNLKYLNKENVIIHKTEVIVSEFYVFPSATRIKGKKIDPKMRPDRSGDDPFDW